MKRLFEDTRPEAEELLLEGYRAMPPWKKLEMVWALNRRAKNLSLMGIRARFPGITEEEAKLRLAENWLTPDELRRWYDWDPSADG